MSFGEISPKNKLYSSFSGDVSGTGYQSNSTVLTLNTVNSNVGSFGSNYQMVSITVNAKGLITAVSQSPVACYATDPIAYTFFSGL